MLGTIIIKKLHCHCIIGILPEERQNTQDIYMDLEIRTDFLLASNSELVSNTIEYAELSKRVITFVSENEFYLMETLVRQTLTKLMDWYQSAHAIQMIVYKPKALEGIAEYPAVKIAVSRSQDDYIWSTHLS